MAVLGKLLGIFGGLEAGKDLLKGDGPPSDTEEALPDAVPVPPVAPSMPELVPPSSEPEATSEGPPEELPTTKKSGSSSPLPTGRTGGDDSGTAKEYLAKELEELLHQRDEGERRDSQYRRDVEELRYSLDTTNSILRNNTDLLRQGLNLQYRSVAVLTDILHAVQQGGGVKGAIEEMLMGAAGGALLGGGPVKGAMMLARRGTVGVLKSLVPKLSQLAIGAIGVAAAAKMTAHVATHDAVKSAPVPRERVPVEAPSTVAPRGAVPREPHVSPNIHMESYQPNQEGVTLSKPEMKFLAQRISFKADKMVFKKGEAEEPAKKPEAAAMVQRASFEVGTPRPRPIQQANRVPAAPTTVPDQQPIRVPAAPTAVPDRAPTRVPATTSTPMPDRTTGGVPATVPTTVPDRTTIRPSTPVSAPNRVAQRPAPASAPGSRQRSPASTVNGGVLSSVSTPALTGRAQRSTPMFSGGVQSSVPTPMFSGGAQRSTPTPAFNGGVPSSTPTPAFNGGVPSAAPAVPSTAQTPVYNDETQRVPTPAFNGGALSSVPTPSFNGGVRSSVPTPSFSGGVRSSVPTPSFNGGVRSSVPTPMFSGGAQHSTHFSGSGSGRRASGEDAEDARKSGETEATSFKDVSDFKSLPIINKKSKSGTHQYEAYAMNFFKSKGYTDAQSATIMGNIQQESSFDPNSVNPNDAGPGQDSVGIGQWNRKRLSGMHAFVEGEFNKPYDKLSTQEKFRGQLGYLDHELHTKDYAAALSDLKKGDAAAYGHDYEGYGDDSTNTRLSNADRILREERGGRYAVSKPAQPPQSVVAQAPTVHPPTVPILHDRPPVRNQTPTPPAPVRPKIDNSISVMNVPVKAPGLSPNYYAHLYPHLYGDKSSMSPETNARTA